MTCDPVFTVSPFSALANRALAGCWAGRPALLSDLRVLQRSLLRGSDSTLDVVWANLGAGKTHLLYHLQHLLTSATADGPIACVCEMPEQITRFLDLYRRIMIQLPLDRIAAAACSAPSSTSAFSYACNALVHGDHPTRAIACEWLRGGRPHLADLRRVIGISHRLDDDTSAADAFGSLLSATAAAGIRVVVMIDEFQRVSVLRPRAREAVLSSLRSVFSATPSLFSVVLAAATRAEGNAVGLLPPELRTLIGPRPRLALPEMTVEEAHEFLAERMNFCLSSPQAAARLPFSDDTIRATLSYMHGVAHVALSPRRILQVFGQLYARCDDTQSPMPADEAIALVSDMAWEDCS